MKTTLTFKEWLQELLQDERGATSVKPLIALIGSLFLCITMVINSSTHGAFEPSETLVNAILVITSIGMGADSLDKWSLPRKNNTTDQPDPKNIPPFDPNFIPPPPPPPPGI